MKIVYSRTASWKRYCHLPPYVFCGDHLLCARLSSSNRGAAHGVVPELKRIVRWLREARPQVRITVRGDSGFSNDELMSWYEAEGIDYVLGLAKNDRLKRRIETRMDVVRKLQRASGEAVRQFQELRYRKRESWSCERRVVAKVEHLPWGANPLLGRSQVGSLRDGLCPGAGSWGRTIAHECPREVKCPWTSPDFGFHHRIRVGRTALEFIWLRKPLKCG